MDKICNFCGKMFNIRGHATHLKVCELRNFDFDTSNCRFCNEECSHKIVFQHEEVCDKRKHFGPFQNSQEYYKDIFNYDVNDKKSKSSCRHCGKTFLSINIFKHEENCLRQFDKFIGPMPEMVTCEFCFRKFYKEHNKVPCYFNGKPEIREYPLYQDHLIVCREKHIDKRPDDERPKRILGLKNKIARNILYQNLIYNEADE